MDSAHGVHGAATKWCVDSAVVWVVSRWQEGTSFEFVTLAVGAVPDPDCSAEVFEAGRRPNPRMQPTIVKE